MDYVGRKRRKGKMALIDQKPEVELTSKELLCYMKRLND